MFFKLKPLAGLVMLCAGLNIATAHAGTVTTDGQDLVINTHSGLELKTTDDAFSFKISGKIQYDMVAFSGLAAASQNKHFASSSDAFVRRGHLNFEGTAFTDWSYGVRVNYNGLEDGTDVDRVWIARNFDGIGKFTLGKFGVNYGLENATSSSWITAAELPAMYDLLSGGDDTDFGLNFTRFGDNYSLMAQVATQGDKPDDGNSDIYGYTLRATWAPILQPDQILHLGIDYHDSNPRNNETKIRSRFGVRSDADDRMRFADIENTSSDNEFALEAAWQYQSLRLQSEYYARQVHGQQDGDDAHVKLNGYYAQISYLIGSQRGYDAGEGKWKAPKDFGTFEPFIRYERTSIDANKAASQKNIDSNIDGVLAVDRNQKHNIDAFTVGVNYFVNKNVRVTLDYLTYKISNIDTSKNIDGRSVKDSSDAVQLRLQYAF